MSGTVSGPQRLPSVAKRDYHHHLVITAILALLSIGGTWWYEVPLTLDMSGPLVLLPFLCGPLMLFTGFFALRGFLRLRKIGTPVLEYSPARLGSLFSGAIVFDKPVDALGDFILKLNCHAYGERDHNGERSPLSTKALWSSKTIISKTDAMASGRIKFTIKLPTSQQLALQNRETYWKMDIKAPMRGVNFFARFTALRFH